MHRYGSSRFVNFFNLSRGIRLFPVRYLDGIREEKEMHGASSVRSLVFCDFVNMLLISCPSPSHSFPPTQSPPVMLFPLESSSNAFPLRRSSPTAPPAPDPPDTCATHSAATSTSKPPRPR